MLIAKNLRRFQLGLCHTLNVAIYFFDHQSRQLAIADLIYFSEYIISTTYM